ncbi:MAG: amidase family protein [Spirosomataceae bacterium]
MGLQVYALRLDVSRHGAMALSWTMDKIGPMARTVEDCALVFEAIRGSDGLDATVKDVPFNYVSLKTLKGTRIGYLKKRLNPTPQPFQ